MFLSRRKRTTVPEECDVTFIRKHGRKLRSSVAVCHSPCQLILPINFVERGEEKVLGRLITIPW
jgi:hypothetical protein